MSTSLLIFFSAWKTSLDSKMYFVPMFDDTDGYYASASGVSLPSSFTSSALELIIDKPNLVVVLLGRPS